MFGLWKYDMGTEVTSQIPDSNINISDDKKVEIITSLMESFRSNIGTATDRAFKTVIWSSGLVLTIVGYWILHGHVFALKGKIFVAGGAFLFGILSHFYLLSVRAAHKGNAIALAKCEAILKLCDLNAYIKGERFFGYSGKWLPPRSLTVLQIFHFGIFIASIITISFIDPIPKSPG